MDKKSTIERIIAWLSFIMIALGGILRVVMYSYDRSLFLDEAYLASSVINRGYLGFFRPLDFSQGAPLGYLWLVKTCVYLFGPSEYSLRLVSLLAGIGAVALFYFVLKNVFVDPRPYIGTAFFATIPFLIYYSVEFKPYMLDGFLTLLSVYLFSLALKHKMQTWMLCLYCAMVVWVSFPAIFTVAAFCLTWFGYSLVKKQKVTIQTSLITGLVSLASFGLLFVTIYQVVRTNISPADKYFDLLNFPLLPHSLAQLKLIYAIGRQYLSAFGRVPAVLLLLLTVLALILLWSKNRARFAVFVAVEAFLLLVASWLGRYPIVARYVIFIIPLHVLFACGFLAATWNKWKTAAIAASILFIVINLGSVLYFLPQNVYRNGKEINPVVKKLETLDGSTPLYLYVWAIPPYEYKSGYKAGLKKSPGMPFEKNNVIYGSMYFNYKFEIPYSDESVVDPAKLEQNVKAIESHDRVYLLFADFDPLHRDALLTELQNGGTVSEVYEAYGTPLYLYQKE